MILLKGSKIYWSFLIPSKSWTYCLGVDGAKPSHMNKKINKLLSSFIVFPMITSITTIPANIPSGIVALNSNTEFSIQELFEKSNLEDNLEKSRLEKAAKIDQYLAERDMPLAGFGYDMVLEAEKNNLDWRLVAAIGVRESSGGRHACKKASFNAWGWHSCKSGFSSYEKAIEEISAHLGGNNERTSRYYAGKTTEEIIDTYNPPYIVPKYKSQVLAIMNNIEKQEI